jgi:signal transduction histidine kinase
VGTGGFVVGGVRPPVHSRMRTASIRPYFVAASLACTTVLAAVLTVQAVGAARYHHDTGVRVLRDYAALGADAVAFRLRNALTSRFYPVLTAAAAARGSTPPTAATLEATMMRGPHDVLNGLTRIIWMDSASGKMLVTGAPLGAAGAAALERTMREATRALPGYSYFGMGWLPGDSGSELVVFQPLRSAALPHGVAVVTVPAGVIERIIAALVEHDPVLPASLSHGASTDSAVGVRVTSAAGDLANRRFEAASDYRARQPFGAGFGDLAVDVSLSESLVPRLIIGGLPRSRVPLLVTLFAVTLALTVAAGYQLRRERELSRLRDDFVTSVSHELRTPLAQIRLFTETLRLGRVRSTEEGERSLSIVENEAKRLEHLVENLLHFSRAERGDLRITAERTDLTALLQQIVSEFAPLAAGAGSFIRLSLAADVAANVDRAAIRQVVLNLLDNAVKYGRKGQAITVRLTAAENVVRIEVEDQGAGIPPEIRARIWERFWRADSARQTGATGTGIGLAIVNDLVRLHGGWAAADGAAGGGARVVISLPRA